MTEKRRREYTEEELINKEVFWSVINKYRLLSLYWRLGDGIPTIRQNMTPTTRHLTDMDAGDWLLSVYWSYKALPDTMRQAIYVHLYLAGGRPRKTKTWLGISSWDTFNRRRDEIELFMGAYFQHVGLYPMAQFFRGSEAYDYTLLDKKCSGL